MSETRTDGQNGAWPLIGPQDPPPLEVLNPDGRAQVLLVGDHAGRAIPRAMANLGLDEWVLSQHVAYDIGSRELLEHLATRLDASAVLAGYSRLLIDLNRSLGDPTAIPPISDGNIIPGNQNLSAEQRALRVQSFYTPYRAAIDARLRAFRERGIVPALIAIHSFTPMLAGVPRPWHIGLLWDVDPRIPVPLLEKLRAHPGKYNIGDNQPYSGKHPADYTIDHHAEAAGLPHVSIEVRQDLIDTPEGVSHWVGVLGEALAEVLADPGLYRLWEN